MYFACITSTVPQSRGELIHLNHGDGGYGVDGGVGANAGGFDNIFTRIFVVCRFISCM
jgi:hypothetical protein